MQIYLSWAHQPTKEAYFINGCAYEGKASTPQLPTQLSPPFAWDKVLIPEGTQQVLVGLKSLNLCCREISFRRDCVPDPQWEPV